MIVLPSGILDTFFSGQMGQRAIIGKGLIDLAPGFPPAVLLETTQQAINNTQRYNTKYIFNPFSVRVATAFLVRSYSDLVDTWEDSL